MIRATAMDGTEVAIELEQIATVGELRNAVAARLGLTPTSLRLVHEADVLADNDAPVDHLVGESLFAFAAGADLSELLPSWLETSAKDNAMQFAVMKGNVDMLQYFVTENEVDGFTDVRGCTLLHLAAQCGQALVTEELLTTPNFTRVDAVTLNGETCLHLAASSGYTTVVQALLATPRFSEVNAVDRFCNTALHIASGKGHIEIVQALLADKRFTAVNEMDGGHETALQRAKANNHNDIAVAIQVVLDETIGINSTAPEEPPTTVEEDVAPSQPDLQRGDSTFDRFPL